VVAAAAAAEEEEVAAARLQCAKEEAQHVCTFCFVAAEYVLQSSERTLPPFQQLQCIPGAVTRRTITREDAFHAVHAGEFLAVSHRWFEQDKPDAEGHQTTALRTYLADHPEIRWVWYDYWSSKHLEVGQYEVGQNGAGIRSRTVRGRHTK